MSRDKYEDVREAIEDAKCNEATKVTTYTLGPVLTAEQRKLQADQLMALSNLRDAVKSDNGGLRYNSGKPRFDLVPPEAMIALADHFRKGAEKYADRNWERGMDWGKCFASMERHAWAWAGGDDFDPETESHHMIAVAWNALALYVYHQRNIGKDDRTKYE